MKKRILCLFLALILVGSLMISAAAETAAAEEPGDAELALHEPMTTNAAIEVTYSQSDARSMLKMINDFRADKNAWLYQSGGGKITVGGLSPLTYDYTLEAVAMRRAAELAVCYSHTRPDGTNCFTAFPANSAYSKKGENVSAGIHTAEQTFNDWKEDGATDYDGQAHRRSMLSGEFNTVGISHVRFNGLDFWVQIFGQTAKPDQSATAAADKDAQVEISIVNSSASVSEIRLPSQMTLKQGETADCPSGQVLVKLKDTWPAIPMRCCFG